MFFFLFFHFHFLFFLFCFVLLLLFLLLLLVYLIYSLIFMVENNNGKRVEKENAIISAIVDQLRRTASVARGSITGQFPCEVKSLTK